MHSAGITVRPIRNMTGNDHFCEVIFNDVHVPAANLIGEVNQSFKQVLRQLEHERGGIDRLLSNYALYRDLLATLHFDPADPLMRQEVAEIETAYRLGRLMVLREVLGQAPAGFSAVSKTFCTEFETRLAGFCARQIGPEAMLWGTTEGMGGRAARAICYSPVYTIMGGTVSILRNAAAERILGLPR